MSAPALQVYINGTTNRPVSGDNLNTFQQTCDTFADLRAFIGTTGLQVFTRGGAAINDGSQGSFYWSSTSTAADDNGSVIRPNGLTVGAWLRITSTSSNIIALFASPPPIGNVTPNTGAFTTLTSTGGISVTLPFGNTSPALAMTYLGATTAGTYNPRLSLNGVLSGAITSGPAAQAIIRITTNSDSLNTTGAGGPGGLNDIYMGHTITAGATGGRNGIYTLLNQTGATTMRVGDFLVGVAGSVNMNANAGGVSGDARGNAMGSNPRAILYSGATWINSVIGSESDFGARAGSSVGYKYGATAVLDPYDAVAATVESAGFMVTLNGSITPPTASPGLQFGLLVGAATGWWPVNTTTGTIIGVSPSLLTGGPAPAAKWGVDFNSVAFASGGGSFRAPGFLVGPSGTLTLSGTFNAAAVSTVVKYPTDAAPTGELTFVSNHAGWNTVAAQNLDNAGYSAFILRDKDGIERSAFGYSNPGGTPASIAFYEVSTFTGSTSSTLPPPAWQLRHTGYINGAYSSLIAIELLSDSSAINFRGWTNSIKFRFDRTSGYLGLSLPYTTPLAPLDVLGTGLFGDSNTSRGTPISGNPGIAINSSTGSLLRGTKAGIGTVQATLNGTGSSDRRLDFINTDNSNVIPLSLALDGSRNVTAGPLTADKVNSSATGAQLQINVGTSADGPANDWLWSNVRWYGTITGPDPSGVGNAAPNKFLFTNSAIVSSLPSGSLSALLTKMVESGNTDPTNVGIARSAAHDHLVVNGQIGASPTLGPTATQPLLTVSLTTGYSASSQGGLGGWTPGNNPATGYYRGALTGGNDNVWLSASPNFSLIVGREINTSILDTSTAYRRFGLLVVPFASARQADADDAAIAIAEGTTVGFSHKVGLQFGTTTTAFNYTDALIKTVPRIYPAPETITIPYGIDLNDSTFTTAAIRTPGFLVDGSGKQTAVAVTATSALFGPQSATVITNAVGVTYTAAQMLGTVIIREGLGSGVSDTTATAAQLVAAIPGCVVGTGFRFIIGRYTNTFQITLLAGSGVTLNGTATVAANRTREWVGTVTNVGSGTEAVTLTSYGSGQL